VYSDIGHKHLRINYAHAARSNSLIPDAYASPASPRSVGWFSVPERALSNFGLFAFVLDGLVMSEELTYFRCSNVVNAGNNGQSVMLCPFKLNGLMTLCLSRWDFQSYKSCFGMPKSKRSSAFLPLVFELFYVGFCVIVTTPVSRGCSFAFLFDYDIIGFFPVVFQWLCRCPDFFLLPEVMSSFIAHLLLHLPFVREGESRDSFGPLIGHRRLQTILRSFLIAQFLQTARLIYCDTFQLRYGYCTDRCSHETFNPFKYLCLSFLTEVTLVHLILDNYVQPLAP
jgi:hypothetical protein